MSRASWRTDGVTGKESEVPEAGGARKPNSEEKERESDPTAGEGRGSETGKPISFTDGRLATRQAGGGALCTQRPGVWSPDGSPR